MAARFFSRSLSGIPLRWVLVVPFVLQTVGAVALVGYLSYRSGQQTVENLANQLMEETGNLVVHQLNANLEVAKLANRTNASAIRAGYIDGLNLKTVEPHYVEQLRLMPRLSALGVINEKREFLAVERPQPHSLIIRRFQPTGTDWGLYRYFADQNGKNLVLQDIRRNYDPHHDPPGNPWYEKARRSPNGTWRLVVTLAMGQDAPILHLIHALPFNNASGKFTGVLAAGVYLTQLGDFLKNLHINKTGQVFLIEQDGLLVATSTGEVPFDRQRSPTHAQNVDVKHRRLSALQSPNPLTRAAATYLLTPRGQATGHVSLTQSQSASFWFNHQRYFIRTVPLTGELNWLAIVVVPESDFTEAIETNNAKTALLSWLTLFVATGLGILTSRWITKPILRLSQASHALAEGKWQQSLTEDSPIAELKTLTTSFNQTAEQLQRSFDRTKLALYESQDKFAKIFRTSPDLINIVNLHDGTYVEVNDQFVQATGYSREEVIGRQVLDLNLLADADQELQLDQLLQTGQPIRNFEIKLRTKAGQVRTGLMSSELIDLDGQRCVLSVFKDVSDRKRAEEGLRRSEMALQEAQRVARVGSWEYDLATGATVWSKELYRIHQRDSEQPPPSAEEFVDQLHPEDRLYYQAFGEQLLQGRSVEQDFRIRLQDGSWRYLAVRGEPILDEQGQVIRLVGTVLDVTDRKQLELALEASRAQLNNVLNSAIAAITRMHVFPDCTYQVQHVSAGVEFISGYTPEELITRIDLWTSRILLEDWQMIEAPLFGDIFAARPGTYEYRFCHKDGNWRWFSQANSSHWDITRNCWVVTAVVTDISDRKQAELELTTAHELREAIFNEATDAIFLVEPPPNAHILDCNQCAVQMFEVERKEDLIGIQGNTLQKTQFTPEELAAIGAELMQKGYWSREIEYVTKKGRVFWGNLAAKPIQIGGQVLQLVRLTDISDRHELDRIKDEFISIVSHELRTPLTAIRGSLGILETGILNEEPDTAHHMLQVALRNSDRLVRLVNDILDLERLESGKVQLVQEPCWVSDLMEMALEGVQAIALEADITLHSTPIDVQVYAAPDAIVQALTNLLGNAIKFSSPGSMVWLKAEIGNREWGVGNREQPEEVSQSSTLNPHTPFPTPHTPHPTPHILFSIKDQGRGIPADKLDNIFGRFQQVDVSDARQKGGTGLGLAICKSIIQQHGGQIWAESVVGDGSTFYFTLPLGVDQNLKGIRSRA